jgi:hypothetical protein
LHSQYSKVFGAACQLTASICKQHKSQGSEEVELKVAFTPTQAASGSEFLQPHRGDDFPEQIEQCDILCVFMDNMIATAHHIILFSKGCDMNPTALGTSSTDL